MLTETKALTGKKVPAIALVACSNKDGFHNGVYIQYLIAIDCTGKWYMWDDPSPVFIVKFIEQNAQVEPDIVRTTCIYCKRKGIK